VITYSAGFFLYSDSFCSRFEDKLSEVDVRTIETFYGKGSGEWYSVHMDMVTFSEHQQTRIYHSLCPI
jgi:hypothetical protein